MIVDFARTDKGAKVLGLITGLGLALIFRKVCYDRKCIVLDDDYIAKMERIELQGEGNTCFTLMSKEVKCV